LLAKLEAGGEGAGGTLEGMPEGMPEGTLEGMPEGMPEGTLWKKIPPDCGFRSQKL
jgi:hypothetical protein